MVQYYIQNFHTYRYAKVLKDQYNILLKLLTILFYLQTNVTLDFVTGLFISYNYNIILMIVDCLIKKRYYILYIINKNGTTTKTIAQFLLQNV